MVVALAAAVSRHADAQRLGPAEERPELPEGADTNSAQAYYDVGLAKFERDPDRAAAAFYWAARINPAWGDALYARRAALLMKDKRLLARVMEEDRRTLQSPEVRRLDSLQFRALMSSPFLYRRLDRKMFTAYIRENAMRSARTATSAMPERMELDRYIEEYLREAGPAMRGWAAYGDGDFRRALDNYARAVGQARNKSYVHFERARIFGMRSESDSAIAEFNLALEELRKKDQEELVVFYDSKALAEYSIAVLLEGTGNTDGAREAYGRALQEDLSYYPAHMRLGLLALAKHDTAVALSELALAAQLAPDEPHIRYVNGYALAVAHRLPDAEAELKKAVSLEPMYALPYLRLGQVYEAMRKGPDALAAYRGFLAHASAQDAQRQVATDHAANLAEMLQFAPAPAPAAAAPAPKP